MPKTNRFSQVVSVFHNRRPPEREIQLVGYSALIKAYDLQVPTPDVLSAISHKYKKYQQDNWMMFSPRHKPDETLYSHLIFALKAMDVFIDT